MIKILHTADIHLDAPLRSLALRDESLREAVQAATRVAFARIIDVALSERVAALLIAGDLFDGRARSARTAAFLTAQLDRLRVAGIPVFYIKGNHDAENPITGALELPDNVHVFNARGCKVHLAEDLWIHGVSFADRHAPESLLPRFPAPVPGAVNIAMLHTSLAGAAARLRDTHGATLARARALLDALTPHLDLAIPDVAGAVAAARRVAETEQTARRAVESARETLRQAEADLAARIDKHAACQHEADAAVRVWQSLVTESLGDAIAPESLLAALDPLRSLAVQEEKRAEAERRVTTMERDQALFAEKVVALAEARDLPPGDTPAETFATLRAASEAACSAAAQAEDLDTRVTAAQDARTQARRRLAEIAETVTTLACVFPHGAAVDTLDALRATAHQAAAVIADRATQAALIRRITSELDAGDVATARARLEGADPVALEAAAEGCKADLARTEAALTDATEARVTARQALAQVTGDVDIATLTERRSTLELDVMEAAQDHLELSLGHRLAEAAIRRYRDTHRSGMMAATERCFSALTRGAYARLTTQPDGAGEALLAVDGTGKAKRVAEMSKGGRIGPREIDDL